MLLQSNLPQIIWVFLIFGFFCKPFVFATTCRHCREDPHLAKLFKSYQVVQGKDCGHSVLGGITRSTDICVDPNAQP